MRLRRRDGDLVGDVRACGKQAHGEGHVLANVEVVALGQGHLLLDERALGHPVGEGQRRQGRREGATGKP